MGVMVMKLLCLSFSPAKRNQCFPPAVHHHLGIRPLCLSAQGQHSDLVFHSPALATCPFPKCIEVHSDIYIFVIVHFMAKCVTLCQALKEMTVQTHAVWRTIIATTRLVSLV